MTSISAFSSASATFSMQSPRDRINDRLSAAVSSGEISADDQSALSSALDSIDSSLQSEMSSGTKPSGDMKSKMESLIQEQVDNGTLTEDQASELKSLFSKGPDGARGPGGAGGPPPVQSTEEDDSDDDDDSTTTSTTSTTTSSDDVSSAQLDALMTFLQQLRDNAEDSTSYSANGDTSKSSSSQTTGLLVDTLA